MKIAKQYIPQTIIYVVVFLIALIAGLMTVWTDDAISYSFLIPLTGEDQSYDPIHNLGDVWLSQSHHYFNANGRFVVHFIVQVFCALLPKGWFIVINSLVWGALASVLARFGRCKTGFVNAFVASALCILLLFFLPFSPPYQINYVWSALFVLIWLRWFFAADKPGVAAMVLLCIGSFLIGEMHEGFSLPICGSLVTLLIYRKGHLSRRQWFLGLAFGAGAILLVVAPGNFNRMAAASTSGASAGSFISELPNLLWFPLIALGVAIAGRVGLKASFKEISSFKLFILALLGFNLLLVLAVQNLTRALIPFNLFCCLVVVRLLRDNLRGNAIIMAFMMVGAVTALFHGFTDIRLHRQKALTVMEQYHQSATGKIFIPTEMFLYETDNHRVQRNSYTNRERSLGYPEKPFMVIYPESVKGEPLDRDTNMAIQIAPQAWLLIESASRPAKFFADKIILPGIVDLPAGSREIDFSLNSGIQVDSTGNNRIAIYVNRRPYARADIRIISPDNE